MSKKTKLTTRQRDKIIRKHFKKWFFIIFFNVDFFLLVGTYVISIAVAKAEIAREVKLILLMFTFALVMLSFWRWCDSMSDREEGLVY